MGAEAVAAYRRLMRALADVYRAEGRPGGDQAAAAYERAAEAAPPLDAVPYRLDAVIREATRGAEHPAAVAAREAHEVLRWSATGILDEQIPTAVSDMFAVVVLIGPTGMFRTDEVSSGLFVQVPNRYYPLHAHAAEETYAMLAGEAEWTLEGHAPARRRAGDLIHHPAEAGHATRTLARPILAAWRWSGDLRRETYRLLEDTA